MKIYENPVINITEFDAENIVTNSGPDPTAFDQAQGAAADAVGEDKVIRVIL